MTSASPGSMSIPIPITGAHNRPPLSHASSTPGKIILAATPEVFYGVSCWDVADYAGVAGPVAPPRRLPHASDDVTLRDLRATWDSQLTTFESLAQIRMKPVALLNIEVPLAFSLKLPVPGQAQAAIPDNPALQSTVYEALLVETKGRTANTAFLLLNWERCFRPGWCQP